MYPNPTTTRGFWRDAFDLRQSITRAVAPRILVFGAFALLVSAAFKIAPWSAVAITHLEYTGAVLVLLLVFRTNAGYDRWWEARKLWGGIVNQSRNLALKGIAYAGDDLEWRERFVRWVAALPHVTRRSLRGERELPEVAALLGPESAAWIAAADHMPGAVAGRLATMLQEARAAGGLDGYAFLELDRERALLIDHVGACERILKTPIPRMHSIKIRRFIFLYLIAVPFVIAAVSGWATAPITMLIAYPLLAIDQMGQELENPFSKERLSHLPLDEICATIERNVLAYARQHE